MNSRSQGSLGVTSVSVHYGELPKTFLTTTAMIWDVVYLPDRKGYFIMIQNFLFSQEDIILLNHIPDNTAWNWRLRTLSIL